MIIHQFSWKLLISFKHFGQKHDFSIFVSHKKLIIEYFNFKKCQMKEGKIVEGCVIFFIFPPLLMKLVTQYDTVWLSNNCMLYIIWTLNVPSLLNPTIRSSLILILNKLWNTKNFHSHCKFNFLLELKIGKRLAPRKSSLYTVMLVICHLFFCLKWLTSNVLIPKGIYQKHGYLI